MLHALENGRRIVTDIINYEEQYTSIFSLRAVHHGINKRICDFSTPSFKRNIAPSKRARKIV